MSHCLQFSLSGQKPPLAELVEHPHLTLLPFGAQLTQFNLNICFRGTEIEAVWISICSKYFSPLVDYKWSLVGNLKVEIYRYLTPVK